MSILIKDMEMPRSCFYCPFREKVNPDEYVCMTLNKEFEEPFSLIIGTRHKDCPLVEVPTSHGRLIDVDDLISDLSIRRFIGRDSDGNPMYEDVGRATNVSIYKIQDAPTIIEAEE